MARRMVVLFSAAALAALAVAGPVAGGQRWTKGDAEAMLRSWPPGGDRVYQRLSPGLDIRPFAPYSFEFYCVEDWHVIALAYDDVEFSVPEGPVRTRDDVFEFLGGLRMEFVLDGASVATTPPPIQPLHSSFANDGWEQYLTQLYGEDVAVGTVWAVQWGAVLAPDELSVGEHELSVTVSDTASLLFEGNVVFTVSPSDSVACTGP